MLRGIVEGFYGPPWTHKDRLDIIKFLGSIGLNLYIYAPKDDPYHRQKWDAPYPEDQFVKIKQLVKTSKRNGVDFCFAISPGLTMKYSSEEDFGKLFAKVSSLAELGVRVFGLFFDDIPPTLVHEEDRKRFRSLGEAHAHVSNRLENDLKTKYGDVKLILCPTHYTGVEPQDFAKLLKGMFATLGPKEVAELLKTISPGSSIGDADSLLKQMKDLAQLDAMAASMYNEYQFTFRDHLSKSIDVMWTGRSVCSARITSHEARMLSERIGRKPFLWDNYPVNDYNRNKIFLGPFRGRAPDLLENLSGYVSNPMNEAQASKFVLFTLAEYLEKPYDYDPDKAWENAVRKMAPPSLTEEFLVFSQNCRASFIYPTESEQLAQRLENLKTNIQSLEEIGRARQQLIRIEEANNKLGAKLRGNLGKELRPYIGKMKTLLKLGLASLDLLEADAKKTSPGEISRLEKKTRMMMEASKKDEHQVLGELKHKIKIAGDDTPQDRESYILSMAEMALR